ncbi:hypothetical protein G9A89_001616 [Geosiphon pyriformis]|nr:hypothetical protein G9A89_001616 [Geosiphon pyriformis]
MESLTDELPTIGASIIHHYTWVIPEFSKVCLLTPKPQYLQSPIWDCNVCMFDGENSCTYKPLNWRLKLHPNGNVDNSEGGHLSLYLESIFPNDASASARVNVNFYIGLFIPVQQGEERTVRVVKRRTERHEFLKVKPAWGWPNFCPKTSLSEKITNNAASQEIKVLFPHHHHHFDDDTLIVHVVIITPKPGCDDGDEVEEQSAVLNKSAKFLPFGQALNNPTFSDIKFLVEEKVIYAHQLILTERSHYFKTLIKNDWKLQENPVPVHDVDYDTFYSILYYLYSGTLMEITGDGELVKVAKLKKLFNDAEMRKTLKIDAIHELIDFIIARMAALINDETWDNLLLFAWESDVFQLRQAVYRFTRKKWRFIRETEAYKDILRDANVDLIEEFITTVRL